ncbi:ATP-grasp domain-containing protein [bacterium]|nr:ATP-grasp domain-containing protein [bacterium]
MLPAAGDDPRPHMLIVGCSTRAAAWSAVRGGYRPVCADQFGDLDLHAVAEVIPVTNYPESLPDDLQHVQADWWMYTGAMENHPGVLRLLETMTQLGRLFGTPSASLAVLRDPWFVQQIAKEAGLPAIECRTTHPTDAGASRWLLKPRMSGGGIGIRWANANDHDNKGNTVYWQPFVSGPVGSAVFRVHDDTIELLGITRQQSGLRETGCMEPFGYVGNIGPWPLNPRDLEGLLSAGRALQRTVSLRGVWGIDFVLTEAGPCLLEINPRYTASMELLEWAYQIPCLATEFQSPQITVNPQRQFGKRILYARQRTLAPDFSCGIPRGSTWSPPFFADLPHPGSVIEAGQPLCTVFATGHSADEVERKLQRRIQRVSGWFQQL